MLSQQQRHTKLDHIIGQQTAYGYLAAAGGGCRFQQLIPDGGTDTSGMRYWSAAHSDSGGLFLSMVFATFFIFFAIFLFSFSFCYISFSFSYF